MNKSTGDLLTVDEKFKCPELREYISKDRCINICTARMQNTKCAGHKCECPWRLCIRCVYENEITHFREYPDDIERCRVIDLKKGLCEDHANGNDHNGRRKIIKLAEADDFSAPSKNGKGGNDMGKDFKKASHFDRIGIVAKTLEEQSGNKLATAKILGTADAMIHSYARVVGLDNDLLQRLKEGKIKFGTLAKISRLPEGTQKNIINTIIQGDYSSKEATSLVGATIKSNGKSPRVKMGPKRSGAAKTNNKISFNSGSGSPASDPGGKKSSDVVLQTEPLVSSDDLNAFLGRSDIEKIVIELATRRITIESKRVLV